MTSLSPYWLLLLTLLMPLPFGTDRRGRCVPWVTYTLIGLNVAAYCVTGPSDFARWGLVPNAPHFLSLITGLFLHEGLGHLLGNMIFLWVFGPHVEEALGREAYLALYLGGGIAASLMHMAIILLRGEVVASPLIGASGAISAILAPFAIRFHRAQIRLAWLPAMLAAPNWSRLEVPAVSGVGLWLLWNIGGGFYFLFHPEPGGTAYWAHIGGFVFGLVAAELTGLFRDGRQDYLLQDARSAAARGQEALDIALRKYRAFLNHEPENASVRAELARLLASSAGPTVRETEERRQEANDEMLGAIRAFQKQGRTPDAVRCAGEARALGLAVTLTPRERLRLAGGAEGAGDTETAIGLLRALIAETPDAPEDEMAHLKLGQMLRDRDPQASQAVLTAFLEKYPQSEWVRRVRDLQTAGKPPTAGA
jgi:membrane associated rhomboid family serine protease